jgi:2-methylisocitrate lyase-like PEP mutase family enzyme
VTDSVSTVREVRWLDRDLQAGKPLIAFGVGTPVEALLAEKAGAAIVYVSGYATAAWLHGHPDIGLIGLEEMASSAARIVQRVTAPVLVDLDTGYGDAPQVFAAVRRLEDIGASGIQLEDQTWPKRCGHMAGKAIVPAEVMARKLDAAVQARRGDTIIVARTDAIAPSGLEEAIRRCHIYAAYGADVLFVDAPESREQLEVIASEVDAPLLVNLSETGKTPILPAAELAAIGYDIILYPTTSLRLATRAIAMAYRRILDEGSSITLIDEMASLDELNALVGLEQFERIEARSLGDGGS